MRFALMPCTDWRGLLDLLLLLLLLLFLEVINLLLEVIRHEGQCALCGRYRTFVGLFLRSEH